MLPVFVILAAGIAAGYLLRRRTRLIAVCDRLMTAGICTLLLVLGAWVGSNQKVMSNLHRLSLEAVVICLASMAGSIAMVLLANRLLMRRREGGV